MATFSKRHYERIAEVLKRTKPVTSENPNDDADDDYARMAQWEVTCEQFAEELARTNTMFKKDKFLTACGVK